MDQTRVQVIPPAARVLATLADLAVPASQIRRGIEGPTAGVLDDVVPLLGDEGFSPLDRAVERLRATAYALSQLGAPCSHHTLVTFADLAALIASRAHQVTVRAAVISRAAEQGRRHSAANQARDAVRAWQQISTFFRPVVSLIPENQAARHHARQLAGLIDQATAAAAEGDLRYLPSALTAVRRAVLILPDLASTGIVTTRHLIAAKALRYRRPGGTRLTELPETTRSFAQRGLYSNAQRASHETVARYLTLAGPQPLPQRAAYLAGNHLPRSAPDLTRPRPARPTTVRVEYLDDIVRIHDPDHGILLVPQTSFEAALARPQHTLTALIRHHAGRDLILTKTEPLVTLAALAATHAPHELAPEARSTAPTVPHDATSAALTAAHPADNITRAQPSHAHPTGLPTSGTDPPPPPGPPTPDGPAPAVPNTDPAL
jgi:hypothetical protein